MFALNSGLLRWMRLGRGSHPDLGTLNGAPAGLECSQMSREWLERRLWAGTESLISPPAREGGGGLVMRSGVVVNKALFPCPRKLHFMAEPMDRFLFCN